jgi:hypothetical protein
MATRTAHTKQGNVISPIDWRGKPVKKEPVQQNDQTDDGSILRFMLDTVSRSNANWSNLVVCAQTLADHGALSPEDSQWLRDWHRNRMRVIAAAEQDRQQKANAKTKAREKLIADRAAFKAEVKAERAAIRKERKALEAGWAALKRAKGANDRRKRTVSTDTVGSDTP